jgi:hypothetical protein
VPLALTAGFHDIAWPTTFIEKLVVRDQSEQSVFSGPDKLARGGVAAASTNAQAEMVLGAGQRGLVVSDGDAWPTAGRAQQTGHGCAPERPGETGRAAPTAQGSGGALVRGGPRSHVLVIGSLRWGR